MKRVLIAALFILIPHQAFASWYIINSDHKVVGRADYLPNEDELESWKEFAIFDTRDIPLKDVEFRNNRIVVHTETSDEKQTREDEDERAKELAKIRSRTVKNTCEELEKEGVIFNQIKCSDYK